MQDGTHNSRSSDFQLHADLFLKDGLLPRRKIHVRGANSQRFHAWAAHESDEAVSRAGNSEVPVCKFTGGEKRTLGRRPDRSEDGGLPMAQASAPHVGSVYGMPKMRSKKLGCDIKPAV